MRSLFDVNVLLALLAIRPCARSSAQEWWKANQQYGWATCPLTQNGFARIISQQTYPKPLSTAEAIMSRRANRQTDHVFWPDDVSGRGAGSVRSQRNSRTQSDHRRIPARARCEKRRALGDPRPERFAARRPRCKAATLDSDMMERRRARHYRRRDHAARDAPAASPARWRCCGERRWRCREGSTIICWYDLLQV